MLGAERRLRSAKLVVALAPMLLAAGCATFPQLASRTQQSGPEVVETDPALAVGTAEPLLGAGESAETLRLGAPRQAAQQARQPITDAQIEALVTDEPVDATLSPQTIPQFVSTVFSVLNVPYTMAPTVATRQEIIAGGTGGTISKRNLLRVVVRALGQYGINVYADGGIVTVGSADESLGSAQLIRGREANPNAARVVQIFTVQTIEANVLVSLLQDTFPELRNVRITPDPLSNTLILSGSGRDVAALVRVIRELDQPRFAGAEVLRVEPVFWTADTLAASLEQTLQTEGYVVSRQPAARRSIVILPFAAANQILIFSDDPAVMARVRFWIQTLDQPTARGDRPTTFVYNVRNIDAQSLAQLAVGQSPQGPTPRVPAGVPGAPPVNPDQAAAAQRGAGPAPTQGTYQSGRLVSDPIGNRILFTGSAADFASLRDLLVTLDVPAPQVVIEVMIAEVTLDDATRLGLEFSGTDTRGDGTWTGGTEGGLGLGGAGFLATFVGPDVRARINAEASNNKINILQRPRLVTRSGLPARFQVGSDVPIVTSQRATDVQSGGDTDVLQSVQYRQTGVILDITPVVYGDRVDITINQEVSSAGDPVSAAIASPTILNRSLSTQIAIADGWTGVLGGLISNNYTKGNVGIPFLKDIPLVGSAFQTNTVSGQRTELLILLTPMIIRTDEDMADLADRYSADMNAAFRTGRGWSYTMTPWSFGSAIRGVGVDLPSADPASERPRLFPRRAAPPPPPESEAPATGIEPLPSPEETVD